MFPTSVIGLVKPDHVSLGVQRGKMKEALEFFHEALGWAILDGSVEGDWGQARFVQAPTGGLIVQLTDDVTAPDSKEIDPRTHLALTVNDPRRTVEALGKWVRARRFTCKIDPWDINRVWFLEVKTLFPFSFEFVKREPV